MFQSIPCFITPLDLEYINRFITEQRSLIIEAYELDHNIEDEGIRIAIYSTIRKVLCARYVLELYTSDLDLYHARRKFGDLL